MQNTPKKTRHCSSGESSHGLPQLNTQRDQCLFPGKQPIYRSIFRFRRGGTVTRKNEGLENFTLGQRKEPDNVHQHPTNVPINLIYETGNLPVIFPYYLKMSPKPLTAATAS